MNIIPAYKLKMSHSTEEIINCFCDNLMNKIKKCAAEGNNKTCFDASVYYHKPTGKIFASLPKEFKRNEWEFRKYHFDDYAHEVRRRFQNAGYIVKPTGFVGGIWQNTDDIIW